MKRKNKMIYMPELHDAMSESHNAYIKAMLGQNPKKYPNDFVETLIDERKKQLKKEKKNVQKNKI